MNVFVVNPSLFAPFYDFHLCRALAELGDEVTLVGRPLREHEHLGAGAFHFADIFYRRSPQRDASGRTSKVSQLLKGLEHGGGLKSLVALARARQADIVHFQWLVVPFLDRIAIRRLSKRCGLVLTVHNSEIATHSRSAVVGAIGAALQSIGQRDTVRLFDRYIVHSEQSRDRLIELGIPESRVIHRQHPPLTIDASSPGLALSGPGDRREILMFGAIKPYKGIDVLIEAGLLLAARRKDFRITIAGQSFLDMNPLRSKIEASGLDEFFRFDLNFVSEARLAEYLSMADIVVFPYREIDGSGALSHAVQFGKPIVASRVGGFAESPFAEHLELVSPGDAAQLAGTLGQLLDDPAKLKSLAGKTAALRGLLPTWCEYARSCHAAYEDIVRGQTRK